MISVTEAAQDTVSELSISYARTLRKNNLRIKLKCPIMLIESETYVALF
jgi:hypothetical protein